jgi:hypothetical protein
VNGYWFVLCILAILALDSGWKAWLKYRLERNRARAANVDKTNFNK